MLIKYWGEWGVSPLLSSLTGTGGTLFFFFGLSHSERARECGTVVVVNTLLRPIHDGCRLTETDDWGYFHRTMLASGKLRGNLRIVKTNF